MTFGLGFILLILAVSVTVYALLLEPLLCELVEVDIPSPILPKGLRILFLSDMHHHKWGKREESFLKCLPRDSVDMIVYGGDFLGSKSGIDAALRFVSEVSKRFPDTPTYGVCGNAEHKLSPQLRESFLTCLRDLGVVTLGNTNVTFRMDTTEIAIIGTDDPYYGFHDLDASFSGTDVALPSVLITHSPQVIRSAIAYQPALVLSGHTHGGQVRIPGLGAIRTQNPLSRTIAMGLFNPEVLSRHLRLNVDSATWLYISRGLGLAFVPHMRWLAPRLLCRPEVTLISISR